MNTNAQIFLYDPTAAATHLAGVAWIDLYDTTSGAFSLVRGVLHKLTPCSICDALGETMILEHAANVQVFKYDECKSTDQLAAFLMGEVATLVCNALVNVSNHLAPLVPFWTAFLCRAQFPIRLRQPLFCGAEKARVCDGFTIRQRGKFFQPHVYARRLCDDRQRLDFAFDTEAS